MGNKNLINTRNNPLAVKQEILFGEKNVLPKKIPKLHENCVKFFEATWVHVRFTKFKRTDST